MAIDPNVVDLTTKYQETLAHAQELPAPSGPAFFSESVHDLSVQNLTIVRNIVGKATPELTDPSSSLCVLLTGSDGRLEKSRPESPVELVVVTNQENLSPRAQATKEKIVRMVENEGSSFFFQRVEERILGKDQVSLYVTSGPHTKTIPTRSLDAQFVLGNPCFFVTYKEQLLKELVKIPKLAANFKKDFLRPALVTLSDELKTADENPEMPKKKERVLGVHLAKGILQSDGQHARGPKYGLLRSVQYSVALSICQNASKISGEELRQLPQTIPQRISWLQERKFTDLTSEEASQLQGCYAQGLLWYAEIQDLAEKLHASAENIVMIKVDSSLLAMTFSTAQKIVLKIVAGSRKPAKILSKTI